jgi:hypothetical protein
VAVPVTQRDRAEDNAARRLSLRSRDQRGERRPAVVWGLPFALVLGILLVRNAFLFTTPEYENADMAANSILIEQARRWSLLVGNYSREKFNHPGPAFLYVQSWGESVFYDALHLVPTAWNGQLIAVYLLNAFFASCVVVVGYGWGRLAGGTRGGVRVALLAGAGVALLGALHPSMFSSDWMPYVYIPAYLAFIVSVASVAAGARRDAWIAALSGWFLIHGHACFLLFVPLLWGAAILAVGWRWRRAGWAAGWAGARSERRTWLAIALISALFALPILVELALHWPGNFGKYFSYSGSGQSGGHTVAQVTDYAAWFWWPHAGAAVAGVLAVVALIGVWRMPAGPVRTLSRALLVFDALSTAGFILYAAVGIDALNEYYIGYFYWSAPVIALMVIALAVTAGGYPPAVTVAVAAVAAVAACAAFAVAGQTRLDLAHTDPANPTNSPMVDPAIPAGVAAVGRAAAGRPVVFRFDHDAWPAITGLLVQAERTGVTACVADPSWEFIVSSQFICTPAQLRFGARFYVYAPGPVPTNAHVLARLVHGTVTTGNDLRG